MANGKITLSTKEPKGIPPRADFAIYINFDRNAPHPQRVFQTVSALITAFQHFDKVLCQTIDSNIEPVMMLEEIESGSIKVWLRNLLQALDDDGIKQLDWKQHVGKYLVKAKYLAIDFLNEGESENSKQKVIEFGKKLATLASETDVKHLPDYRSPTLSELSGSLREIAEAKGPLLENDTLSYITDDKAVDFNLAINWTPETFDQFLTKEVIKYAPAQIILAVKKPDYLGNSQWELRHGRTPVKGKIQDSEWLKRFQNREVDVRPHDSLRCMVEQEFHYGYDNELIAHVFVITQVIEVLENRYHQRDLLETLEKESKNANPDIEIE